MKVVLATGGSGGHIFPALTVAEELKQRGHEAIFIGAFGNFRSKVEAAGFPVHELDVRGLDRRSMLKMLVAAWKMLGAMFRSLSLLGDIRPAVVAGFGGYGAFPVLLAAVLSGRPTVIHEQNAVPGRANRFLGGMVRRIAVSFRDSQKFFPAGKSVWTGCPCRAALVAIPASAARQNFGLDPATFTILVLGGSQGSRRINEVFLETAPLLRREFPFQVIHLCGEKDLSILQERYVQSNLSYRLIAFLDEMAKAYVAADLVVSRAGAVTVSEIARFNCPSVLIPYPYAGAHQRENAKVLADAGAAVVLEESALTPASLKEAIRRSASLSADRRKVAEKLADSFLPDASQRVAQTILDVK